MAASDSGLATGDAGPAVAPAGGRIYPRALVAAAPAMGLALLLLLPFYRKAYTMDDTLFMLQAQQLLRDPLHPTALDVVWAEVPQRLSAIMPSGPVMAYLLWPAAAHGGAEWLAHGVQGLVLGLGLWATAALALRLGYSRLGARLAALLVATTPAVLGMAGTVMPDIPAMAFGVLALDLFVGFTQASQPVRKLAWGLCASLALALAALSRPHLSLLVFVAALLSHRPDAGWDRSSLGRWLGRWLGRSLWPLGLAGALCLLALRITQDPLQDTGVTSSIGHFASLGGLPKNLLAFFAHASLALPLCLPWAVLRRRYLSGRLIVAMTGLAALLMIVTGFWGSWGTRYAETIYLSPILGLAVACFVDLLRVVVARRERLGLALFAWLCLPLPMVFYVQLPTKYWVPTAPAVALLLLRELGLHGPQAQAITDGRMRRLLGLTLGLGALLGVLIVRTDAAFAELGRRAAAEQIAPRVQGGESVWFVGRWGFQWYAQRAGARTVTRTPPWPAPGSIVVASNRAADSCLIEVVKKKRLLAQLGDIRWGGRVMADEVGAGFFSNGWGLLPWMISAEPLDRYDIYRVE